MWPSSSSFVVIMSDDFLRRETTTRRLSSSFVVRRQVADANSGHFRSDFAHFFFMALPTTDGPMTTGDDASSS
jgi:hypothetical protein